MTDQKLESFIQRYEQQNIPWDTGITPPEIIAIVAELSPGKALDLGCGTGTNVRFLLEHGWQADGIDFVPHAIEMAGQKLNDFPTEQYGLYCHDVTRLDEVEGLRSPYDLVIDIGCGHSLSLELGAKYARDLAALLKPGGVFMLYTHFPIPERNFGWTDQDVQHLFATHFDLVSAVLSTDTTNAMPSGWFRLIRKA